MRYFAYGSNMSEERMQERLGREYQVLGKARLKGYKLAFNKQNDKIPMNGYANLMEAPESVVEGVLYEVGEAGMHKLDRKEGVPAHYRRAVVQVETDEGVQEAVTYMACPEKVREGLLPTEEYLRHLLKGKKYLSEAYYNELKHQPTLG